jgi:S1-C subfamily serine protease
MDEQLLLDRATRALGTAATIGDAFQRVRAIIGPLNFPQGEALAQEAMEQLRKGIVPTPEQRVALETVVKALRPSVLSEKGKLTDLPVPEKQTPEALDRWQQFRTVFEPYLYSVGRIDRVGTPADVPLASGFLIAKDLLVTNKHVLASLSADTMTLQKGQAVVRFGQEYQVVPDPAPVAITGVRHVDPSLDIAVLEVDPVASPALVLAEKNLKTGAGVAVVGYPQQDTRNPVFTRSIFLDKYKVKRVAPGEIVGAGDHAIHHDCSTLGGNSGSPVVDLESGAVVGLHYDGRLFLFRNEAVDAASLYGVLQPLLG